MSNVENQTTEPRESQTNRIQRLAERAQQIEDPEKQEEIADELEEVLKTEAVEEAKGTINEALEAAYDELDEETKELLEGDRITGGVDFWPSGFRTYTRHMSDGAKDPTGAE